MADHCQLIVQGPTAVNVAIPAAHRAFDRSKISPHDIEQRLAKGRASSLIANERTKHVTFLQKHSAGGADCFLAAAKIDAADDHAAAIKTGEFVLEDASGKHPAKPFHKPLVHGRFLR